MNAIFDNINRFFNYLIQNIDNKYVDTILLFAALILIGVSIYDIYKAIKGGKKSAVLADRIKSTVAQDKIDIAKTTVTTVVEQSVGNDIWRIFAIKIAFDDNGIIGDSKVTTMLDNHWEPLSYSVENGFLFMRQKITKITKVL